MATIAELETKLVAARARLAEAEAEAARARHRALLASQAPRRSARIASQPAAFYFKDCVCVCEAGARETRRLFDLTWELEHQLTCLTLLQTTRPGVALVLPMVLAKWTEAEKQLMGERFKPWAMRSSVAVKVPNSRGGYTKDSMLVAGSTWDITTVDGKEVIYCDNKLAGYERQTPLIFTNGLPCKFV